LAALRCDGKRRGPARRKAAGLVVFVLLVVPLASDKSLRLAV